MHIAIIIYLILNILTHDSIKPHSTQATRSRDLKSYIHIVRDSLSLLVVVVAGQFAMIVDVNLFTIYASNISDDNEASHKTVINVDDCFHQYICVFGIIRMDLVMLYENWDFMQTVYVWLSYATLCGH